MFTEIEIACLDKPELNGHWFCYRHNRENEETICIGSNDEHVIIFKHDYLYMFKLMGTTDEDGYQQFADLNRLVPDAESVGKLMRLVDEQLRKQDIRGQGGDIQFS